MNKYKRRHGSGNTSKGIYVILFGGLAAFGIYKVVRYVRQFNAVHEMEMKENKKKTPGSYILKDSLNK